MIGFRIVVRSVLIWFIGVPTIVLLIPMIVLPHPAAHVTLARRALVVVRAHLRLPLFALVVNPAPVLLAGPCAMIRSPVSFVLLVIIVVLLLVGAPRQASALVASVILAAVAAAPSVLLILSVATGRTVCRACGLDLLLGPSRGVVVLLVSFLRGGRLPGGRATWV